MQSPLFCLQYLRISPAYTHWRHQYWHTHLTQQSCRNHQTLERNHNKYKSTRYIHTDSRRTLRCNHKMLFHVHMDHWAALRSYICKTFGIVFVYLLYSMRLWITGNNCIATRLHEFAIVALLNECVYDSREGEEKYWRFIVCFSLQTVVWLGWDDCFVCSCNRSDEKWRDRHKFPIAIDRLKKAVFWLIDFCKIGNKSGVFWQSID